MNSRRITLLVLAAGCFCLSPSLPNEEEFVIANRRVTLYAGQSLFEKAVCSIREGEIVQLVAKEEGFYRVRLFGNTEGFLQKGAGTVITQQELPERMQKGTYLNADEGVFLLINMDTEVYERVVPTFSGEIAKLRKDAIVRSVGRIEHWHKVILDDGRDGWVHDQWVDKTMNADEVGEVREALSKRQRNRDKAHEELKRQGFLPIKESEHWTLRCKDDPIESRRSCWVSAKPPGASGVTVSSSGERSVWILGDHPDGHLKIPHLWPGQNPPGDSRGIGYRQSVSRSILIPFSSADFLFAGQPDGGLFEAVAAAFKLEQVAAVQEPVQHRR